MSSLQHTHMNMPLPASIFFTDLEMKLIHDETIPEFDETNSALDESKKSDV